MRVQAYERFIFWAGVALFCALALMPCRANAAHEVTLREESLTVGPVVRLGDIATVAGQEAERLAAMEIVDAARPGSSKRVAKSMVGLRIRNAGFADEEVALSGPSMTTVTTSHREIGPEEIVASLRRHILSEMPWQPDSAEVDIPAPREALCIPDADYVLEWRTDPQYGYVGSGVFRGAVMINGEERQSLTCRARIDAYGDIVVAARDIPRGRPIAPADLATRKQRIAQMPRGALLSVSEAVGLVTRKSFFRDQPLTAQGLEARTVVRRNQVLPVEMRAGAVWVQTQARALSDGRLGDWVIFANLNNKQEFQGYIREDGVIVVQ